MKTRMGLGGVLALCAALASPLAAGLAAEISGEFRGFDQESGLVAVNTRLGPRTYLLTASSLVLLNNHDAAIGDLEPGDEVEVRYDYRNAEILILHARRENKARGTILRVSQNGNTLDLRLRKSGATLGLTANADSVSRLNGLRLTDRRVLAGTTAEVIYEPGPTLVLSLEARAEGRIGVLTALDTAAETLSIRDRGKTFGFSVDDNATIYRGNASAELDDLVLGDRVRVLFLKEAAGRRALALEVRRQAPAKSAAPAVRTGR